MKSKNKNIKGIFFLIIIYLAFIALGLPDTGFGVAWNKIRLEFNKPLEAAGLVTMIVTIFSAVSGFSSGYLLNRFGTGRVSAYSCLATGLAILGYTISKNYISLLIMAIPLGFGAGAVDSGLNNYVAENLSSKHMNWLHSSWGIGATLSPLIITTGITYFNSWRVGYGIISALILILSLIILLNLSMWAKKDKKDIEKDHKDKPYIKGIAPILSVTAYIIYVAMEAGLGLWLSALLIEARGLSISLSGTMVSIYFGSIMIGRFLMGFISNKLGNRKLINIGLAIAFSGCLAFLVRNNSIIYCIGVFLIGFGFAPIYPSMMHETPNRYGTDQAKRVISNQVAFSYISVLTFVPLLGLIATHTNLEIIPIFIILSVSLLYMVINRLNTLT